MVYRTQAAATRKIEFVTTENIEACLERITGKETYVNRIPPRNNGGIVGSCFMVATQEESEIP